uniref:NAM-associated domain-containing protein n=1 Tax=Panagrellus redivivus TaxID=6233 RepID=A0A7E4URI7_PANRE
MRSLKKDQRFEVLKWKALVCGDQSPLMFGRAMETSRGWESERDAQFPLDIILALSKRANIWKFVLGTNGDRQPQKIDIRIGVAMSSSDDTESVDDGDPTYEDAKNAQYNTKATLTFERRHKNDTTYEAKTMHIDAIGQFIWLVVYGPHEGATVQLSEISIYGYTNIDPNPDTVAKRRKEQQKLEKDAVAEKEAMELNAAGNGIDKLSISSASGRAPPSRDSMRSGGSGDYKIKTMDYSSANDGVKSDGGDGDGSLGGDPLTAVRTVKKILEKKGRRARGEDKEITAQTCKRAVQRLDEYEERIKDLLTKRSKALENDDFDYAERFRLAAIDCRDTVFRVIHLDLLLDEDDLESLGMASKWAKT